MPQLDKLTFISQLFWLFILFFILYIVLREFIIPRLYTNLRVRHYIMSNSRFTSHLTSLEGKSAILRALVPNSLAYTLTWVSTACKFIDTGISSEVRQANNTNNNGVHRNYIDYLISLRVKYKLVYLA